MSGVDAGQGLRLKEAPMEKGIIEIFIVVMLAVGQALI